MSLIEGLTEDIKKVKSELRSALERIAILEAGEPDRERPTTAPVPPVKAPPAKALPNRPAQVQTFGDSQQ